MTENHTANIKTAINLIDASWACKDLDGQDMYVYYAEEVSDWVLVDKWALLSLADDLAADDCDEADVYSLWCAGPGNGELMEIGDVDVDAAINAAYTMAGN